MKMRVVLDTNVLLASFSRNSPYSFVMDEFRNRKYSVCLTTEILFEYEEKLLEKFSAEAASLFLEALPDRPNVEWINIYYKWNLVYPDLDENKFVDCAIAANAEYLVTNDRDNNPLKKLAFPKLTILKIEEFIEILSS
jgi:uncharacterized protein